MIRKFTLIGLSLLGLFMNLMSQELDSITDKRDNQVYRVVKIGDQWWMAENLDIGKMINTSQAQTDNNIIEKYCYNYDSSNCAECGGLYQWDEMMQYTKDTGTRGICPEGWHVPSDKEWKQLEMELGMTQSQADASNTWRGSPVGTKLKDGGSSGMDINMCGIYRGSWGFNDYGSKAYPYTSTKYEDSKAWRRCFSSTASSIGRWNTFPRDYALSVRCVSDSSLPTSVSYRRSESLSVTLNSTTGRIKIRTPEYEYAEVYDKLGRKIMMKYKPVFHLSGLSSGMYILVIHERNGKTYTRKVIYTE